MLDKNSSRDFEWITETKRFYMMRTNLKACEPVNCSGYRRMLANTLGGQTATKYKLITIAADLNICYFERVFRISKIKILFHDRQYIIIYCNKIRIIMEKFDTAIL